jgi:hypothetical protein
MHPVMLARGLRNACRERGANVLTAREIAKNLRKTARNPALRPREM